MTKRQASRPRSKWAALPREPGTFFIIILLAAVSFFTAGTLVTLGSIVAALVLAVVVEGLRR